MTSSAKHRQNTNPRRSFEIRHDFGFAVGFYSCAQVVVPS